MVTQAITHTIIEQNLVLYLRDVKQKWKKIINNFNVGPTFGWSMLDIPYVMGSFLPIVTSNALKEIVLNFFVQNRPKISIFEQ